MSALSSVRSNTTIVLAPGTYRLSAPLKIAGPLSNVVLRGQTNRPADVIVAPVAASTSGTPAAVGVTASGSVRGLVIANLTLRGFNESAIVLSSGSVDTRLYNVALTNAGRAYVSAAGTTRTTIEYSTFDATGRADASAAVDARSSTGWTIRHSKFIGFGAPAGQAFAPAIAFHGGSSSATVEANSFVNCQQEIAFGLTAGRSPDNRGGVIRNNFIARAPSIVGGPAIVVAASPSTQVVHNSIVVNGTASSAVDVAHPLSTGVIVTGNLTDAQVVVRDGAQASTGSNETDATPAFFVDAAHGNLHLAASATTAIDALPTAAAITDWDGDRRPAGNGADFGADERVARTSIAATTQTAATTTDPSASASTRLDAAATPVTSSTLAAATTAALPSPWQSADIGSPSVAGSATYSSGTYTVKGAGADVWGTADQFRFVYQPVTGDGTVIARVATLQTIDPWTKAGVMIRQSLQAGSAHAFMLVSASSGLSFQRRVSSGASSVSTSGISGAAPYWVRLVRSGSTITASRSTNGSTWTTVGSASVPMSGTIYVGLAVTSHSTTKTATATFTNVSVTAATSGSTNKAPTVSLTSPTASQTFAAPANVYISATASDSDGSIAKVELYAGSTLIKSDVTNPYVTTWQKVPAGTYTITAIAQDNKGARTTSAPVTITVGGSTSNKAPTVSLTSPSGGSSYTAPASISIAASAADSDGSIAKVDFYSGGTLLGSDTSSPYTFTWSNVAAGTYSITAVAQDDKGARTTSGAVSVTVSGASTSYPKTLAFTPSSDNATNVTSYRFDVFRAGADPATATPVGTQNLGKPAAVNGTITVDIGSTIGALPTGSYIATVTAIGPGGSTRSAPSATFSR